MGKQFHDIVVIVIILIVLYYIITRSNEQPTFENLANTSQLKQNEKNCVQKQINSGVLKWTFGQNPLPATLPKYESIQHTNTKQGIYGFNLYSPLN